MMPASGEIIEALVHFASHGDYAHSDDGKHEKPGAADEDGCSPLFHACACHASAVTTAAAAVDVDLATPPATAAGQLASFLRLGRSAEPPPHRPPIA